MALNLYNPYNPCLLIFNSQFSIFNFFCIFTPEYGYFSHQVSPSGTPATVAGDAVGMFFQQNNPFFFGLFQNNVIFA